MDHARTMTRNLALTILVRDGIAAIWQLHLAATEVHRAGNPSAAASILEITDAAEEAWTRAEGARSILNTMSFEFVSLKGTTE
jgi:hypothetical protein